MNLLQDKWISVVRENGIQEEIAPYQITDKLESNPIVELVTPRPDFQGAMYQFLIGLIQTVYAPKDEEEWKARFYEPPTTDELKNQTDKVAFAFELFGDGVRFMQDTTLSQDNEKVLVSSLLIESPGKNTIDENKDLFIKRNSIQRMCPKCVGLALFTLQTNSPSGGSGHNTSIRGGGPLTTILRYDSGSHEPGEKNSLWRNIWINIIDQSVLRFSKNSKINETVFPWMTDRFFKNNKNGSSVTIKDLDPRSVYWSFPRRIMLDSVQGDGVCNLCNTSSNILIDSYRTNTYGLDYGGGASASIGYTDPSSQLGLTSTIDRNGLSTSAEYLGTSLATMTQDGIQMEEVNWMQQNINAAQDATETMQGNVVTLLERGYTEEQIRNMSSDEHNELANTIRTENENKTLTEKGYDPDSMTDDQKAQALYALQPDAPSPLNDLLAAMGTIGASVVGAVGYVMGSGNNSNTANNANAEPLVGRRREDEEGGEPDASGDKDVIPRVDPAPIPLDSTSEPDRLTQSQLDGKIQDVYDGTLTVDSSFMDDSGLRYVVLSDGTTLRLSDVGSFLNRNGLDSNLINTEAILGPGAGAGSGQPIIQNLWKTILGNDLGASAPTDSSDLTNNQILNSYADKKLAEIYVLGTATDAENYIKTMDIDSAAKKVLIDQLEKMKTEWRNNEKTKEGQIQNRNLTAMFTGLEVIQNPGTLPVYKNKNGAIIPFPQINSEFDKVRVFDDGTKSGPHKGVDMSVIEGTPNPAISNGVVVYSKNHSFYGNTIVIDHGNGNYSMYAHNSKMDVKVGDYVRQGQKISETGNTGSGSKGPHMHFATFQSAVSFSFPPRYSDFVNPEELKLN